MKTALLVLSMGLLLCDGVCTAAQQKAAEKSLAQLELTMEVATTTDDGYPAALRITLRNVGVVTIDLPLLKTSCTPEGGIDLQMRWTANDPTHLGFGWGGGCGSGDNLSLLKRIKEQWIRLRPGEYMTMTESIRGRVAELTSGTLEYWAEYIPPEVSARRN